MPGTSPETTIPASAPGESAPLSAKTVPVEPPTTVNPLIMASDRRESIVTRSLPARQDSDDDAASVALKQFVNDDRHFSLVRNFRLADLITILNGVCGSLSIFSSATFLLTYDRRALEQACVFPVLSLGFDFMDGKVARFRNESSVLGQELDSLADLISFGVAPALVGFAIGLRHPLDVGLLTFFVCAGLARLARFNSTAAFKHSHPDSQPSAFEGLPIPTSLWLVGCMYQCIRTAHIELPIDLPVLDILLDRSDPSHHPWLQQIHKNGNKLFGGLVSNPWHVKVHWMSIMFGTWAILMLSKTLKVPKL